jgi:hypothetical protein
MLSFAERQAIAQRDAFYLPRPLQTGSDPGSMAAHLRQVVGLLRTDARAAVTYLTDLYERSIPPRADIACAKGCAHCCVQTVVVTAAEAFAVAADLREGAVPADYPKRRLGEPRSAWTPCAFLQGDGGCGVYAARPLACHGFVSRDLSMCIGFFSGKREEADFKFGDRQQVQNLCRMMLCAAHLLAGRGPQPGYELTGAVAAILATPDAEARWRRGEDVFRDVPPGPPIPPGFAAEIERMAAFVAPTI